MRRVAFELLVSRSCLKPTVYSSHNHALFATRSSTMHHLQYRTTREPVVHDLSAVDDSEPERQEVRRLQKEKKRAAKSNQENYPTQPLDALSARGANAGEPLQQCGVPSETPLSPKGNILSYQTHWLPLTERLQEIHRMPLFPSHPPIQPISAHL